MLISGRVLHTFFHGPPGVYTIPPLCQLRVGHIAIGTSSSFGSCHLFVDSTCSIENTFTFPKKSFFGHLNTKKLYKVTRYISINVCLMILWMCGGYTFEAPANCFKQNMLGRNRQSNWHYFKKHPRLRIIFIIFVLPLLGLFLNFYTSNWFSARLLFQMEHDKTHQISWDWKSISHMTSVQNTGERNDCHTVLKFTIQQSQLTIQNGW